jgi:hypothetical protein
MCAKSNCGLPARSGATQMQISRAHYDLNCAYGEGMMTFAEYRRKLLELKRKGLIKRR